MVGPPVFSGISFEPSVSAECVYSASVLSFHDQVCTYVESMHVCVLIYTCANSNGVCLCVGCGQLPCVHRGEVVSDTTAAVSLPQPGGVSTLR